MPKKDEPINLSKMEPGERLKYEIAEELGLLDKVKKEGWKALSAKDTGRIGGLMNRRKRAQKETNTAG